MLKFTKDVVTSTLEYDAPSAKDLVVTERELVVIYSTIYVLVIKL